MYNEIVLPLGRCGCTYAVSFHSRCTYNEKVEQDMSKQHVASPIMLELLEGSTHDANGVPVGLVNWMVLNNAPRQRAVRVQDRMGYMHFRLWLDRVGIILNIWNDLDD
jgi:hypothetical protein